MEGGFYLVGKFEMIFLFLLIFNSFLINQKFNLKKP